MSRRGRNYWEQDRASANIGALNVALDSIAGIVNTSTEADIERTKIESSERMFNAQNALTMMSKEMEASRQDQRYQMDKIDQLEEKYSDIIDYSAIADARKEALSDNSQKIIKDTTIGLDAQMIRTKRRADQLGATNEMLNKTIGAIYDDIAIYKSVQDDQLRTIAEGYMGEDYDLDHDEYLELKKNKQFKTIADKLGITGNEKKEKSFLSWMRTGIKDRMDFARQRMEIEVLEKQKDKLTLEIDNEEDVDEYRANEQQMKLIELTGDIGRKHIQDAQQNAVEVAASIHIAGLNASNMGTIASDKEVKSVMSNLLNKKDAKAALKNPYILQLVKYSIGAITNQGTADGAMNLHDYAVGMYEGTLPIEGGVPDWMTGQGGFADKWMNAIGANIQGNIFRSRVTEIKRQTSEGHYSINMESVLFDRLEKGINNPLGNVSNKPDSGIPETPADIQSDFVEHFTQGLEDGIYYSGPDGYQDAVNDYKNRVIEVGGEISQEKLDEIDDTLLGHTRRVDTSMPMGGGSGSGNRPEIIDSLDALVNEYGDQMILPGNRTWTQKASASGMIEEDAVLYQDATASFMSFKKMLGELSFDIDVAKEQNAFKQLTPQERTDTTSELEMKRLNVLASLAKWAKTRPEKERRKIEKYIKSKSYFKEA